jgi:hypothetical protein
MQAEGCTMRNITRILAITPRSVAFHKYRMMEDLGIKRGAEQVQYAVKHHMLNQQPLPCQFASARPVSFASSHCRQGGNTLAFMPTPAPWRPSYATARIITGTTNPDQYAFCSPSGPGTRSRH